MEGREGGTGRGICARHLSRQRAIESQKRHRQTERLRKQKQNSTDCYSMASFNSVDRLNRCRLLMNGSAGGGKDGGGGGGGGGG